VIELQNTLHSPRHLKSRNENTASPEELCALVNKIDSQINIPNHTIARVAINRKWKHFSYFRAPPKPHRARSAKSASLDRRRRRHSKCKFHLTLGGARNSQSESKNAHYFSVSNDLPLKRNVQKIASWRIFQIMHSERGQEQQHWLHFCTLCVTSRLVYIYLRSAKFVWL